MATIAFDFKVDENDDLYIDEDAMDFVIAPSDKQHVKDLLVSVPGWYKEFPLVGWNPYARLNARGNKQQHNQSAKIQLQGDGYIVNQLDVDLSPTGELSIKVIDVERP